MKLGFPAFPLFAAQFRHPFLRAQDPHGKKRAKQQPQLFSSTPQGFFCFWQRKKQTKNPII
jgi:hypothetical protein